MKRKTPLSGLSGLARCALAGGVLAATAALTPAHAGTVTLGFESHTNNFTYNGSVQDTYFSEGAYKYGLFSAAAGAAEGDWTGLFMDGTDLGTCVSGQCPTNNSSTFLAAFNDSVFDLFNADGGQFMLSALDASFIGDINGVYPSTAGYLRLQGIKADGSYNLIDLPLFGPTGGAFGFASYNLSGTAFGQAKYAEVYAFAFACTTSSSASCSALSSDRGQFALDNLRINTVPEPASLAVLGLGAAALFAARRRRAA